MIRELMQKAVKYWVVFPFLLLLVSVAFKSRALFIVALLGIVSYFFVLEWGGGAL